MSKIGCFCAFSHFFCFWGPFFENFEPKICFFSHQMRDALTIVFVLFFTPSVNCVYVLFQPFPIPHHIISFQFFFLHLSKKIKQCLVENNAQLQKLYFATQPGTGFIFYFYRGILWISLLTMKTYDFTLQDNMRRTWHWTEVGSNEHN